MREATKEEIESINRYVKSISKPTCKNFNDLIDDVQEELDFVHEYKKIPCIIEIKKY